MLRLFDLKFLSMLVLVLVLVLVLPFTVAQAQMVRPVDEVMQLHVARDDSGGLQLQWDIADKVYMYRDKIAVENPDGSAVPIEVGAGILKEDLNFGETEILHQRAIATIAGADMPKQGTLLIRWQGCEEDSICFPPVTSKLDVQTLALTKVALGFGGQNLTAPDLAESDLAGEAATVPAEHAANQATNQAANLASATAVSNTSSDTSSDSGADANAWLASNFGVMLAGFFGFGLLLSLTPCVFPMIPILSGMLARSGDHLSAGRGFVLSSAYVVAMAGAYAVLGFAASWSGYNLQAALQTPYALGFMALIFVALAFSMFGYYELRLPAGWTAYFNRHTSGKGGAITGALLLGFGSALIVGPCVTPPLAAALLYVAQTGDALRGSAALFALGLGMGVPLIIFGTFGAKFLPKSGPWLGQINQIFGFVFIGLALYMLMRLLSDEHAMLLLALTALACSVFLGVFDRLACDSSPWLRLEKTAAMAALIYGTLLLVGFAGGANDPWRPLGFLQGSSVQITAQQHPAAVKTVKTAAEYDAALQMALASGQPVVTDFTADWCVTCKANDKVMQAPEFAGRLGNLTIIKADITDYSEHSRELMQRFQVAGPPTLMFQQAQSGNELSKNRIVGALSAGQLDQRLQALGL